MARHNCPVHVYTHADESCTCRENDPKCKHGRYIEDDDCKDCKIEKLQAENEELQKQLDKRKDEYKRGFEIGKKTIDKKFADEFMKLKAENDRLRSALQSIINMELSKYPEDRAFKSGVRKAKQALEDTKEG